MGKPSREQGWQSPPPTMERITTHGRFRAEMIARDKVVFPEPELPATPIMLVFAHGGE